MPAEQVPQSDVDGGPATVLRPCARRADETLEGAGVPFDGARVFSEQVGGGGFVHPGGDGPCSEERLADAGQPVVGFEGDVTKVRVFPQPQRRHARDPHCPPCAGAGWHMPRILK